MGDFHWLGNPGSRPSGRFSDFSRPSSEAIGRQFVDRLLASHPEASQNRELASLGRERDPEILYAELIAFANRNAGQDPALALSVLQAVAQDAETSHPASATRAREELGALTGTATGGRRFEVLARDFARQATDPVMLASMATAGFAFQASRAYFLSSLLASPSGSMLTRGFAARFIAASAATAIEIPVLMGTTRGIHAVLGERPSGTLGTEWTHTAITLSALRLFGAGSAIASQALGNRGIAAKLLPTVGSYFGIFSGNVLAGLAAGQPTASFDALALNSFATLLQFGVAGRLSHQMLGENWARLQEDLNRRAEAMTPRRDSRPGFETRFGPALAMANGARLMPESSRERLQEKAGLVFMVGGGNESDGEAPPPSSQDPTRVASAGNGIRRHMPTGDALRYLQDLLARRDRLRDAGEVLSLKEVLQRTARELDWPRSIWAPLHWAVRYREIFESSWILQTLVRLTDLGAPSQLMRRLVQLRERISGEFKGESLPFPTLVRALTFGGKIPVDSLRNFLSWANSHEIYHQSPELQALTKAEVTDVSLLLHRLDAIRASTAEADEGDAYTLSTLVNAAKFHPDFPTSKLQEFAQSAGAWESIRALPRAELGLEIAHLETLSKEELFLQLLRLSQRPEINLAAGTLLMGLQIDGLSQVREGKINGSAVRELYAIDQALERWQQWGGHYRNLGAMPFRDVSGDRSRIGYARDHFYKGNGRKYQDNTLHSLVRAGVFLWQHREALRLPDPEVQPLPMVLVPDPPSVEQALAQHRKWNPDDLEGFLLNLLRFKRGSLATPVNENSLPEDQPHSLRVLAETWGRATGRSVSRTVLVHAAQVDIALARWAEWHRHYEVLAEIPASYRPVSRMEYARQFLRGNDGEEYSDSVLGGLVRWGSLLWNNQGNIHLNVSEAGAAAVERPPTPVEIELAMFRKIRDQRPESLYLSPRKIHSGATREFFENLIRLRGELRSELALSDPATVSVYNLTRHYLSQNDLRKDLLLQYAAVVDEILDGWSEHAVHYSVLANLDERRRPDYLRIALPDLTRGQYQKMAELGPWLWHQRTQLGLASPEYVVAEVHGVDYRLIPQIEEGTRHIFLPKPRFTRPSKAQNQTIIRHLMHLRRSLEREWNERESGNFPEPRLADLFHWVGFFRGEGSNAFANSIATAQDILKNWSWWGPHAARMRNLDEIHALRYLRDHLDLPAPELLRHIEIARIFDDSSKAFGLIETPPSASTPPGAD